MKQHILFLPESLMDDYYENDMNVRKVFPQEFLEENSFALTLAVVDTRHIQVTQLATLLELAQEGEYLFLDENEYNYLSEYL
jgi:hypothetical protein